MSVVEKIKLGSVATLLSTELNSLANNANSAPGSEYDNSQGAAGDGFPLADVELLVSFGTAPTVATALSVWFLSAIDGTNYSDGSSTDTPARTPDAVFPVRAVTGGQRLIRRNLSLPSGKFKALLRNEGTGQALAASGNTLRIRPYTSEGVEVS